MTGIVSDEDALWLRYSFELAVSSRAAGDQPFGAVLVGPENELVVEALNTRNLERDIAAHAEMNLVRRAVHLVRLEELLRCTLYCSSEPCLMCAGAMYWSKIGKIVWGADDEKNGHKRITGVNWPFHQKSEIVYGVLKEECGHLMKDFFKNKR